MPSIGNSKEMHMDLVRNDDAKSDSSLSDTPDVVIKSQSSEGEPPALSPAESSRNKPQKPIQGSSLKASHVGGLDLSKVVK